MPETMPETAPETAPPREPLLHPGALRRAAATMTAVLGSLSTTVVIRHWTAAPLQVSVLAVVLCLTLSRAVRYGAHLGLEAGLELLVLAWVAGGVAWLLVRDPSPGEALLVLGLSVGILARRCTGAVRRAGRVVTHPFLAVLITPVPVVGPIRARDLLLWSPVGVLVAAAWTAAAVRVIGGGDPVVGGSDQQPRRAPRRRVDAPTRMALQMLVGLGVAMVVGRVLFDDRWAWCVLSAYLVASGNRGRGDVAHKASLRVVGALVGTVVATLGTSRVPPGHAVTLVALFAVMAVALVLRERSYAFWAVGMTAMLSLLHAYYGGPAAGQGAAHQLLKRMAGVALGSAIGLLAAWLVLPVRTRDVFRGRVADCLRSLTDELAPEHPDSGPVLDWPTAVGRLGQIRPGIRAAARHHPRARSQLRAIHALQSLRLPEDEPERLRLRRDVIRVRRSLVGTDHPAVDELAPVLQPVLRALADCAPSAPSAPSASAASAQPPPGPDGAQTTARA